MSEKNDLSGVHHQTTSILVESDWINQIFDEHGGLVQKVACELPGMNMYMSCHCPEGTVAHLFH